MEHDDKAASRRRLDATRSGTNAHGLLVLWPRARRHCSLRSGLFRGHPLRLATLYFASRVYIFSMEPTADRRSTSRAPTHSTAAAVRRSSWDLLQAGWKRPWHGPRQAFAAPVQLLALVEAVGESERERRPLNGVVVETSRIRDVCSAFSSSYTTAFCVKSTTSAETVTEISFAHGIFRVPP